MCENCCKQPDGGKTWKEVNKEHYDNKAKDIFQLEWIRNMQQQVAAWLQTNRAWIGIPEDARFEAGTGVRILDYACGNGVLSLALAPYAAHVRGIDISSTMVQLYNDAAAAAHLGGPGRMRAVEGDLVVSGDLVDDSSDNDPALATPEFDRFDLALISMALHHVEDPVAVLRGMATRVRPGGKVLVIDCEAMVAAAAGDQADNIASALKTIAHNGFSVEEIKDILGKAGLVNSATRRHPGAFVEATAVMTGAPMQLFYAVAERPATASIAMGT